MNPFKTISNLITTTVICLFLVWLGLTIFKLGASSERNPLLKPLAHNLLGIEDQKDGKNWLCP